jgi:thiol-disulfide isomerase/thioredoxin
MMMTLFVRMHIGRSIVLAASMAAMLLLLANPLQAASPMPHFELSSATGGSNVNSSDFQGKVLLVNFFATWCPPCRHEIPSLIKLEKKFGPKGFSIIGISVDQGSSKVVKKFVEKMDINYPVGMATEEVARDFGGVVGIPVSFLVDRQGNVVKTYPGYVEDKVLEHDINSLL